MKSSTHVKVVIYVPKTHANKIRKVLGEQGAGQLGNYAFCSFSTTGYGRFKPLKGSNPTLGKQGKIEKVLEERIETICDLKKLKQVLTAVKKAHPYEEPAIDIVPLLNHLAP